jgi:hypothetical protein
MTDKTNWPSLRVSQVPFITKRDLTAEVQKVLAAMHDGAALHHQIEHGGHRWSLSNGTPVDAEVAALVTKIPQVTTDADVLFAGVESRSFVIKGESK